MLEKELKVLLNKEQYDLLLRQFNWDEIRTQTNFYYTDKENNSKNQGITIRVRQSNDKIVLQIKIPIDHHEQGALHFNREYETELNEVPEEIEGTFLSNLCSIPLPNVSKVGYLITERYIYNWNDDIEISLDKNKYLNVEDYEIEIEYKENIDPAILDILAKNKIQIMDKVEGKCGRFFNQLHKVTDPSL